MTREISVQDRSIASLIFGFLLACYLLTYTGFIQSSDGLSMFATVESMVRRGEIDSNQLLWMGIQQGSFGPDGELYSRKGLGMPLLAYPLVWLANRWHSLGLVHAALLLNPLLTAWTGALMFRMGRRLDWSRTAAILTALVFGLATLAWPYTQTFFSDPVTAWGLFGAFYGMFGYRQTNRKRYLFLAGVAWGIAYLSRVVNLVTLPVYLILLVTVIVRSVGRSLLPSFIGNLRALIVQNWRAFASFMLPVTMAGIASLQWNWLRYGSVWDSGYVEAESFSANWIFGITGLLVGPARGLFWYAPVLLLAIPGAFWFWRQKRWLLLTNLAICVIFVLLYGKWFMWHGGFSWGPRFMVALLPFATLLTGPVFERLFSPQHRGNLARLGLGDRQSGLMTKVGRGIVISLLVLSVAVQWLGMVTPFSNVQIWLEAQVQPLFAPETFTDLGYSPLLLQWQFIEGPSIPFSWWRSAGFASIDWLGLFIPVGGIVAGIILISRQISSEHHNSYTESRAPQVDETPILSQNMTNANEERGSRYWIYTVAVMLMSMALLTNYHTSTSTPSLVAATEMIEQRSQPDDAILFLRPTLTQDFANRYHGSLPMFGLFGRDSLDEQDQAWLKHLRENYRRLWVFASPGLAEASAWERTLLENDFLLSKGIIEGPDEQRVPLFALPQPDSMVEHGVGAIFGTIAEGEELTVDNGQIRLNGYMAPLSTHVGGDLLLTLRWESLQTVDKDYHVFVHVLDGGNDLIAQRDGQPVQWTRPISAWEVGDIIIDRYGLRLSDEIPPGKYRLSVGLYDPSEGYRLPVNTGTIESAIELEPFDVLP